MALVDAKYRFLYVDVGAEGRISDAGVYNNCRLSQELEKDKLGIPKADLLPGTDFVCPYMLVSDEAFPLRPFLMKPFHRQGLTNREIIFNYRLSRARRVVENAFGLLANRFRIFRGPMTVQPASARKIVLATVSLHNFLIDRNTADNDQNYNEDEEVEYMDTDIPNNPQSSQNGLLPIQGITVGRPMRDAKILRDKLADYFMHDGRVSWQDNALLH